MFYYDGYLTDMKSQGRPKGSSLTRQIEVIRDDGGTLDESLDPILGDQDDNPLQALAQLVEKLEALEELNTKTWSAPRGSSKTQSSEVGSSQSTRPAENYFTLFHKQNIALRKLLSKLH